MHNISCHYSPIMSHLYQFKCAFIRHISKHSNGSELTVKPLPTASKLPKRITATFASWKRLTPHILFQILTINCKNQYKKLPRAYTILCTSTPYKANCYPFRLNTTSIKLIYLFSAFNTAVYVLYHLRTQKFAHRPMSRKDNVNRSVIDTVSSFIMSCSSVR